MGFVILNREIRKGFPRKWYLSKYPRRLWVPTVMISETEGAVGAKGKNMSCALEERQGGQCAWNRAGEQDNSSQGGQRN